MDKTNVKESLLEVVNGNNLEILKIDLFNNDADFAKYMDKEYDASCKDYTTLDSLDFEVESIFLHDEVLGTVYCRDKVSKEPVWTVSCGDEGSSWWGVNRVPEFYKNQFKKLEDDTKADMEG